MAKDAEKAKGTPEIEKLPESVKQEAASIFSKMDGVSQDTSVEHSGGNVHSGHYERARVREMPGRGGPEGVKTSTTEHDPNQPAPRLDIADSKSEFSQPQTSTLISDKYPSVTKAAAEAEKLYGGKDGLGADKTQGQDQHKGSEGKDQGRDV